MARLRHGQQMSVRIASTDTSKSINGQQLRRLTSAKQATRIDLNSAKQWSGFTKKKPIQQCLSEPSALQWPNQNQQQQQHDQSALRLTASKSSPIGATMAANQCDSVSQTISNFIECSVSSLTMPPLPKAISRVQEEPLAVSIAATSTLSAKNHPNGCPSKLNNRRLVNDQPNGPDLDTDGGYAWVILAIVFTINASTFGTARAYGLIFDKLARDDDRTRTQAAMPFTIMGAVENMAGPLSGYLLARTGSWRTTVLLGSCLISLAHFLAAAFESQLGLLLSMGLMCGLGLSFVTISFFQINNAYFERYRSTAFGLGLTGAAFGTLYISPLCQYFLDNYGTNLCYLMLGLILLPNVPLTLLLKPKKSTFNYANNKHFSKSSNQSTCNPTKGSLGPTIVVSNDSRKDISTISGNLIEQERIVDDVWTCIKRVLANPMFHLIWPTQLLFCWFNFVFGMIIVDFGKDRGLSEHNISHLVPIWAFGQLTGRMLLGSLVDFKFISYKMITVICFTFIGTTTWALNNVQWEGEHHGLFLLMLIFVLSMFIALLYIIFNSLVVNYIETPLQPLSIGISSFAGSFFLLPRAYVIGYYRDTTGNYDSMLTLFTRTSWIAALTWLLLPRLFEVLEGCCCPIAINSTIAIRQTNPIWLRFNKSAKSDDKNKQTPRVRKYAILSRQQQEHPLYHCSHTNPNYHIQGRNNS